jgi:hypothetical protein
VPDEAEGKSEGEPGGGGPDVPTAVKPFLREAGQKPGAAQDGSPGDEIAKTLSGLPLALKNLRVDREGIHGGKRHVPWDRITSVTACGKRVTVEGRNEKGAVRRLLHVKVGLQAARAVESLWREVCFRRVQRDGKLGGSVNAWGLRRMVWFRTFVAAALLSLATYRGHVVLDEGRSGDPVEASTDIVEASTDAEPEDPTGLITAEEGVVAMLAWLGVGVAVIAFLKAKRRARLALWWKRWELGREGFFLRDESDNEKRLVLSGKVAVTPAGLRASDEAPSFGELTARPVLARIFVAMAELAGARPATVDLRRFARRLLAALVLLVPGPGVALALVRHREDGTVAATALIVAALTLAVLVAGTCCLVYAHFREQKALARLLEDGRAMLKRLDW